MSWTGPALTNAALAGSSLLTALGTTGYTVHSNNARASDLSTVERNYGEMDQKYNRLERSIQQLQQGQQQINTNHQSLVGRVDHMDNSYGQRFQQVESDINGIDQRQQRDHQQLTGRVEGVERQRDYQQLRTRVEKIEAEPASHRSSRHRQNPPKSRRLQKSYSDRHEHRPSSRSSQASTVSSSRDDRSGVSAWIAASSVSSLPEDPEDSQQNDLDKYRQERFVSCDKSYTFEYS